MTEAGHGYYGSKTATLRDLFGTEDLRVQEDFLEVGGRRYPIVRDVILLLHPSQYPRELAGVAAEGGSVGSASLAPWDPAIQFSFGAQWNRYREILPEHRAEFDRYFDLVDLEGLRDERVCDLGCGNGRWSFFLREYCREMVLVDLSMAIFAARENLRHSPRCLFFMGDLQVLPFRDGFADLLVSLGVLHHLPADALEAVRRIGRYGPRLLIYLYYSLDNRPWHYRVLFRGADSVRRLLCRIRHSWARAVITAVIAALVYEPMVWIGRLFALFGLGRFVPLYETYRKSGWRRICQDVYDRFFTPVEQRVSRTEILGLLDTFDRVVVSEGLPYWHFLCEKRPVNRAPS